MGYVIETMSDAGWTTDGLGDEVSFDTRESAERALASLLDGATEDWTEAEYRIVERDDTATEITTAQIEAIRAEAENAGDGAMEIIARHALGEYTEETIDSGAFSIVDSRGANKIHGMTREVARAECARVIARAMGMDDGE
jgi:hypothetical protein